MKKLMILLAFAMSFSSLAHAGQKHAQDNSEINVNEDLEGLGGNEELMKMAQSLRSETRTRIVQDRIVNRRNKVEFGLSYGGVLGGDSYMQTQSVGLAADYHITPRWSVGVHYFDFTNSLTPEGQRVFDQARQAYAAGARAYAVDVDYPLNATMAMVNWYPIYGKTSFLDMGITQFDLYLLGGAGQMNLSSGGTPVYAAGLGIGAWLSQHISLRAEAKYQTYHDQIVTGSRTLNTVAATIGLGWIL